MLSSLKRRRDNSQVETSISLVSTYVCECEEAIRALTSMLGPGSEVASNDVTRFVGSPDLLIPYMPNSKLPCCGISTYPLR